MKKVDDSGKYWPYMILGFLFIGISLGFWTIKSTISLPVNEADNYMQTYQDADKGANDIIETQERFDSKYSVSFSGLESSDFKPKFLKRKPHKYYKLNATNSVEFKVTKKDGTPLESAKVLAKITRVVRTTEDSDLNVTNAGSGLYKIDNFKVGGIGRYIIRVKISDDKDSKYLDIYGFKAKK